MSEGWNLINCSWSCRRSALMILCFDASEVVKRRSWCLGMLTLSATAAPIELFSMTVMEERAKAVCRSWMASWICG